jgi:gentisate 1,2-dioxygenase
LAKRRRSKYLNGSARWRYSKSRFAIDVADQFILIAVVGIVDVDPRSEGAIVDAIPVDEGSGRSRIGKDIIVEWSKRDIFVVPSWHQVNYEADEDSVSFSFSDRPVQEALYLFRADRGPA